jgi:hypothetical protein
MGDTIPLWKKKIQCMQKFIFMIYKYRCCWFFLRFILFKIIKQPTRHGGALTTSQTLERQTQDDLEFEAFPDKVSETLPQKEKVQTKGLVCMGQEIRALAWHVWEPRFNVQYWRIKKEHYKSTNLLFFKLYHKNKHLIHLVLSPEGSGWYYVLEMCTVSINLFKIGTCNLWSTCSSSGD